MRMQRKPSSVLPQPRPRVVYIGVPASGRRAPTRLRSSVLAAMADAAYMG